MNARVDLLGLPLKANGIDRVRIITQLTRSLVGLSGIERVWIRNDGKPWGLYLMSGGVADRAHYNRRMMSSASSRVKARSVSVCSAPKRWSFIRISAARSSSGASKISTTS